MFRNHPVSPVAAGFISSNSPVSPLVSPVDWKYDPRKNTTAKRGVPKRSNAQYHTAVKPISLPERKGGPPQRPLPLIPQRTPKAKYNTWTAGPAAVGFAHANNFGSVSPSRPAKNEDRLRQEAAYAYGHANANMFTGPPPFNPYSIHRRLVQSRTSNAPIPVEGSGYSGQIASAGNSILTSILMEPSGLPSRQAPTAKKPKSAAELASRKVFTHVIPPPLQGSPSKPVAKAPIMFNRQKSTHAAVFCAPAKPFSKSKAPPKLSTFSPPANQFQRVPMTNERRQPSKTLSSGKQYSNMLPPPVPAPPKMAAWARPPMYSPPRTPKVSTGKKAGDLKKVTPPKPVKVSRPKPVKYQNPKPVKRAKPAKRHAQKKSSSCVVM